MRRGTHSGGAVAPPETPAAATEGADPSRDADAIPVAAWPAATIPGRLAGRAGRFQVVFAQEVIDDVREHGLASPDVEVCGVLVGNVYHDERGPWCHVIANVRGNNAEGRNAQVTFTSDTWSHINATMDTQYPDQRIVGWYHTHPGFGIFLSEMDIFIQQNFFGEPWQIAYVDDPKGGDRGTFVWEKGLAVRREHLVDTHNVGLDPLTLAARIRTDRQNRRARRWRRVRAAFYLFVLLSLLAAAALVSKRTLPNLRFKGLNHPGWITDKIKGLFASSR